MQDSQIIRTEYSDIMKKSYIDYAMSVIVARALPDVRDGLILVDGHGNFGSIEGDGAAAMRYTEARLAKLTQEVFLADLDKGVVDFAPNFDETEKEPEVLPVRIPNLLVNGAEGIAVGMATSIPTHNLGEVIDAVKAYMKNSEITTKQLMKHIKGPDFPTGGIVVNKDDLLNIYETGSGKIKIRGKVEVEELKGGKKRLVISEIPYTMIGAGIGKFLNDVASLVESKKTNDITDISNQSSKEGIRIVLELRKDADVENLKNMLYKKTRLEDTFGVNMLAVANGKPETMGLKSIIEHHVDFQFDVATRKYKTLLAKELDKKEIQEGLIKACNVIDLIIEILRGSKSIKEAKACLTDGITENIKFKSNISKKMASMLRFTERQATAILEMRLYKLIGLEIEALQAEHEQTLKSIARYEDILNNYDSMAEVIIEDLDAIKKTYARKRRTIVENAEEAVFEEKKIEEQEVVFLMDRFGYARTVDVSTYERNREAADSENKYIVSCLNTGKICLFTNAGKMHQVKVPDIPYGKFRDKGTPIDNLSNYNSTEEQIVFVCDEGSLSMAKLLFATKQGMLKQVDGSEFQVAKRTIAATKLLEEDEVICVQVVTEGQSIVLQTMNGYFLRFASTEVPEKKKGAVGVRGIKLQKKDELEQVYLLEEGVEQKVLYKEKEVTLNRLKLARRDGIGTKR